MSTSKQNKEIQKTKNFYEEHAEYWAATHSNSFFHEKEFVALKKLLSPKACVVDIGCAAGVIVPLFLGIGKGLRYCGFDIAKNFITIASRHYPQLDFIQADITNRKTLSKKKFDAFLCTAVLMHVPHEKWDCAFSNIEFLTKKYGYGYLVLPANRPPNKLNVKDNRHMAIKSAEEQVAYMKSRGWKIVKKYEHDNSPTKACWMGYIVQLP